MTDRDLTAGSTELLFSLTGGEHELARFVNPVDFARELAPRPFLHPVRTVAGTVVTDERPEDHRWHLGVNVSLQDVDGTNYWGGRTYVRDQGYTWREDHGTITCDAYDVHPNHAEARLTWRDPAGAEQLIEDRTMGWQLVAENSAWELEFGFSLRNVAGRRLPLGSPGSNGRVDGGYGGFFWRLPPVVDHLDVQTPDGTGEEAIHGRTAPWLLVRGTSEAAEQPFTLLMSPGDEATAADPWFVRVTGYPGVGSSLAWDRPALLDPDERLHRRINILVADGDLDVEAALRLASLPRGSDAARTPGRGPAQR